MKELLRLFSSKVRIKLLDAFLSSPKGRFYIRELQRKTGEDIRNIYLELQNLEKLGLLISEIQGNQKYYSVNKKFFLYPELKSIIFKTLGVQGLLEQTLKEIKGIEWAFIYGSFARGEETESSDVDVLIIGEPNMMELNEAIAKAEERLSREINYSCFTRQEFEKRRQQKDPFILDVLSGDKVTVSGSEDAI